jgi:hypothetical protein
MPIESAASAHSACSFARKPRPASGNNPISRGVAAQCAAQANDAAAPSRSRRVPAVIASNLLKSFPPLFPFVLVEFDGGQFIDFWIEARLVFNEQLAGFIRWTFTAGQQFR